MKWRKGGLIYCPDGSSIWARHTALQPTPLLLNDSTIRIFVGFRDDTGVARVGFVDVDARDPGRVLHVSHDPVLDIGQPGAFDDNGVVPCAVVRRDEGLFLYYAGYQIPSRVKFIAFSGLAISTDEGNSFTRHSTVPVLERTPEELYFRAAHTVLRENGRWRVWYGGGNSFIEEAGRQVPVYDVRYLESPDGIDFPKKGTRCITFSDPAEYRIGRPFVLHTHGRYRMFYGVARLGSGYRMGYAESLDGLNWTRRDDEVGLVPTKGAWDEGMIAYPAVIEHGDRTYMFYNGNDMGRSGFGYAILEEW
jgi:predicted GH43/DUF377 family glycosyl hydrolase